MAYKKVNMLTKARLGLRLLQTPIEDYRKFAVWRILAPY